jgi:hypothetical protein
MIASNCRLYVASTTIRSIDFVLAEVWVTLVDVVLFLFILCVLLCWVRTYVECTIFMQIPCRYLSRLQLYYEVQPIHCRISIVYI